MKKIKLNYLLLLCTFVVLSCNNESADYEIQYYSDLSEDQNLPSNRYYGQSSIVHQGVGSSCGATSEGWSFSADNWIDGDLGGDHTVQSGVLTGNIDITYTRGLQIFTTIPTSTPNLSLFRCMEAANFIYEGANSTLYGNDPFRIDYHNVYGEYIFDYLGNPPSKNNSIDFIGRHFHTTEFKPGTFYDMVNKGYLVFIDASSIINNSLITVIVVGYTANTGNGRQTVVLDPEIGAQRILPPNNPPRKYQYIIPVYGVKQVEM